MDPDNADTTLMGPPDAKPAAAAPAVPAGPPPPAAPAAPAPAPIPADVLAELGKDFISRAEFEEHLERLRKVVWGV